MTFLLLTFSLSSKGCCIIPAVQLARIKLRRLWILDITQSIFDTNISLFFKEMSSSELQIQLSTTRTVSLSLFHFTLSLEQTCPLTTGLKLVQKGLPVLPLLLWGTTAAIWLYKWRDYYLLPSQCHCSTNRNWL